MKAKNKNREEYRLSGLILYIILLIIFSGVTPGQSLAKKKPVTVPTPPTSNKTTENAPPSEDAWLSNPEINTPHIISDEPNTDLSRKVSNLESRLSALEGEIELIKTQSKMIIQNTHISFLNNTYAKTGFSLILPRSSTFSFNTDSGLGAYIGLGHYFGRHHALDMALEWDIYLALSIHYRYELHIRATGMSFAPIIGFKAKTFGIQPFDRFLESPSLINTSFFFAGGHIGFPMSGGSLFCIDLLYLTNQQSLFVINTGLHFFL